MLKFKLPFLVLTLAILIQACGNKKTSSGLEYKILADSAGENAKNGELVFVHLTYNNGVDSNGTGETTYIYADTSQRAQGRLEEGMTLLSKGDSAKFLISNDSLYSRLDSLPKGIKKGSKTTFTIKVKDILSAEKVQKMREEQEARRTKQMIFYAEQIKKTILDSSGAQLKTDDKLIQNYIKKNQLNAQKTNSGIYYVITKEGSGPVAAPGDTADVSYVGKLLNGKEFDRSRPEYPFIFPVGLGKVIPGFDEPLTQIKEGSKATLIIPSPLAYSTQGAKNPASNEYTIPPNSVLVFDIEVNKYSKSK